jgi:hypothetical protein
VHDNRPVLKLEVLNAERSANQPPDVVGPGGLSVSGAAMKTHLKRRNYYLDEKKIRRVRTILGAKTETEAIGDRSD